MAANKYKRKYQKLRDSARGEACTLQLHPYCNGNTETTVLCHLPSGSGIGQKSPDWWAAFGCSDCHDVIDGRKNVSPDLLSQEDINEAISRAQFRTWSRWVDTGLVKI